MLRFKTIKKFLSVTLTISMVCANSAFANLAETKFWEERKLAALPASHMGSLLPLPKPVQPISASRLKTPRLSKEVKATSLAQLMESVSPVNGDVRKVISSSQKKSEKNLIHIQDIHLNVEAQKNIHDIVSSLVQNTETDLILLEGAFGDIDLSSFRENADKEGLAQTVDFLLAEGELSGAVAAALKAPRSVRVVGIDDLSFYDKNVQAYKDAQPLKEKTLAHLNNQKEAVHLDKSAVFNPALKSFDALVESYRADKLDLGAYLSKLTEKSSEVRLASELFLSAVKLEKEINFQKAEKERTVLLERLVQKLNQDQMAGLMNDVVSFRSGKINHAEFYALLKNLCSENELPLSNFPEMEKFVRYVLLTDSVDAEAIFADLAALEKEGYEKTIQTAKERALVEKSEGLFLAERLVEFQLTPQEWNRYKALLEKDRVPPDLDVFANFYLAAEKRDDAFVQNLNNAFENGKASNAILVTGGFHSYGVTQKLSAYPIASVQVTPRVSSIDTVDGAAYLSFFTQEKSPLEKVFEANELFVSPKVFEADHRALVGAVEAGRSSLANRGAISNGAFRAKLNRISGLSLRSVSKQIKGSSISIFLNGVAEISFSYAQGALSNLKKAPSSPTVSSLKPYLPYALGLISLLLMAQAIVTGSPLTGSLSAGAFFFGLLSSDLSKEHADDSEWLWEKIDEKIEANEGVDQENIAFRSFVEAGNKLKRGYHLTSIVFLPKWSLMRFRVIRAKRALKKRLEEKGLGDKFYWVSDEGLHMSILPMDVNHNQPVSAERKQAVLAATERAYQNIPGATLLVKGINISPSYSISVKVGTMEGQKDPYADLKNNLEKDLKAVGSVYKVSPYYFINIGYLTEELTAEELKVFADEVRVYKEAVFGAFNVNEVSILEMFQYQVEEFTLLKTFRTPSFFERVKSLFTPKFQVTQGKGGAEPVSPSQPETAPQSDRAPPAEPTVVDQEAYDNTKVMADKHVAGEFDGVKPLVVQEVEKGARLDGSVPADAVQIDEFDPETSQAYMDRAIDYLIENPEGITFTILTAGAMSRMKDSSIDPEVEARLKDYVDFLGRKGVNVYKWVSEKEGKSISTLEELSSHFPTKAVLPVGKVDGQYYTKLGEFLTSIKRLQDVVNQERKKRNLPEQKIKLQIDSAGNEKATAAMLEWDLEINDFYGLEADQITLRNEREWYAWVPRPEDLLAVSARIKGDIQKKDPSLTRAQVDEQFEVFLQYARENQGQVIQSPTPWGHGEFLNQTITSGHIFDLVERGGAAPVNFVRNVDNSGAVIDWRFLTGFGLGLAEREKREKEGKRQVGFIGEFSERPAGSAGKGGGYFKLHGKNGEVQNVVLEDPIVRQVRQLLWNDEVENLEGITEIFLPAPVQNESFEAEKLRENNIDVIVQSVEEISSLLPKGPFSTNRRTGVSREEIIQLLEMGSSDGTLDQRVHIFRNPHTGKTVVHELLNVRDSYYINNAVGTIFWDVVLRDVYDSSVEEIQAIKRLPEKERQAKLNEVANRGRAKADPLLDPKMKDGKPYVRSEFNMWNMLKVVEAMVLGVKSTAAAEKELSSLGSLDSLPAGAREKVIETIRFAPVKDYGNFKDQIEKNSEKPLSNLSEILLNRVIKGDLFNLEQKRKLEITSTMRDQDREGVFKNLEPRVVTQAKAGAKLRGSETTDAIIIDDFSDEELRFFMDLALKDLADRPDGFTFTILTAGAMSRMKSSSMDRAVRERLEEYAEYLKAKGIDIFQWVSAREGKDISTFEDLASHFPTKAILPVGKVNGRFVTKLGEFLTSIKRLQDLINEKRAAEGKDPIKLRVDSAGNEKATAAMLDWDLKINDFYGLEPDQISLRNETEWYAWVPQPEAVEASAASLKKSIEGSNPGFSEEEVEETYQEILKFAQKHQGDLDLQKTPWGHGEALNQAVESGHVFDLLSRDRFPVNFFRNVDNSGAVIDFRWLVEYGYALNQRNKGERVGLVAEFSERPEGSGGKGGGLFRLSTNGNNQNIVLEDPIVRQVRKFWWLEYVNQLPSEFSTLLLPEEPKPGSEEASALREKGIKVETVNSADLERALKGENFFTNFRDNVAKEKILTLFDQGSGENVLDQRVHVFKNPKTGAVRIHELLSVRDSFYINNAVGTVFWDVVLEELFGSSVDEVLALKDLSPEERSQELKRIADHGRKHADPVLDVKLRGGKPYLRTEFNMWNELKVVQAEALGVLSTEAAKRILSGLAINGAISEEARQEVIEAIRFAPVKDWGNFADQIDPDSDDLLANLSQILLERTFEGDIFLQEKEWGGSWLPNETYRDNLAFLETLWVYAPYFIALFGFGLDSSDALLAFAPILFWSGHGVFNRDALFSKDVLTLTGLKTVLSTVGVFGPAFLPLGVVYAFIVGGVVAISAVHLNTQRKAAERSTPEYRLASAHADALLAISQNRQPNVAALLQDQRVASLGINGLLTGTVAAQKTNVSVLFPEQIDEALYNQVFDRLMKERFEPSALSVENVSGWFNELVSSLFNERTASLDDVLQEMNLSETDFTALVVDETVEADKYVSLLRLVAQTKNNLVVASNDRIQKALESVVQADGLDVRVKGAGADGLIVEGGISMSQLHALLPETFHTGATRKAVLLPDGLRPVFDNEELLSNSGLLTAQVLFLREINDILRSIPMPMKDLLRLHEIANLVGSQA